MTTLRLFLLPKALFLLFLTSVAAYPNGAGSCDGGKAAVGGSHLSQTKVTTGSLADGGYNVTLGRRDLSTDTVSSTYTRLESTLRVKGPAFTGILIRMEAPSGVNTKGALTTEDTNLQTCSLCEYPVQGITHTSASEKKFVDSIFSMRTATEDIFLDITIVVQNDSTGSIYYYSRFPVSAVARTKATPSPGGGTTSTPAPVARTRRPSSSTTTTSTPAPVRRTRRPSSTTTTSTPAPVRRTRRPSSTTTTSTPAPARRTRRPSSTTATSSPGSTMEPTVVVSGTTVSPAFTTSMPSSSTSMETSVPTSSNGASYGPTTLPPAIMTPIPSAVHSVLSDIPTMVPTDMVMPTPGGSSPDGSVGSPGIYPACQICEAGKSMKNPTGTTMVGNVTYSCEDLETAAMDGDFDPSECRKFQMSFSTICACLAEGATLAPTGTSSTPPPVASPSAASNSPSSATLHHPPNSAILATLLLFAGMLY